jgi:hypothetical protein
VQEKGHFHLKTAFSHGLVKGQSQSHPAKKFQKFQKFPKHPIFSKKPKNQKKPKKNKFKICQKS